MKMVEISIKEILRVRGIQQPFKHYGRKFNNVWAFLQGNGVESRISSLRKVAKFLNLPAYFIARMFQLGRIQDEQFNREFERPNSRLLFR